MDVPKDGEVLLGTILKLTMVVFTIILIATV